MKDVLIGLVMVAGGLALWLATPGIETPVISLSKAGLVIAIIGGAEAVWGTVKLLRSSE